MGLRAIDQARSSYTNLSLWLKSILSNSASQFLAATCAPGLSSYLSKGPRRPTVPISRATQFRIYPAPPLGTRTTAIKAPAWYIKFGTDFRLVLRFLTFLLVGFFLARPPRAGAANRVRLSFSALMGRVCFSSFAHAHPGFASVNGFQDFFQ